MKIIPKIHEISFHATVDGQTRFIMVKYTAKPINIIQILNENYQNQNHLLTVGEYHAIQLQCEENFADKQFEKYSNAHPNKKQII